MDADGDGDPANTEASDSIADTAPAASALHEAHAQLLAYSATADEAEPSDEEAVSGSASRYALAGLLVLITAGAFVVTAALLMAQLRPTSSDSATPSSTATGMTGPGSAPPRNEPSPPSHEPAWWNAPLEAVAQHITLADADAAYLSAIESAGLVITTPERAIANGHSVCQYLAEGHTPSDAILNDLTQNPTMSTTNARDFIYAAINAYCPQFR